jgi:hypothetical protein
MNPPLIWWTAEWVEVQRLQQHNQTTLGKQFATDLEMKGDRNKRLIKGVKRSPMSVQMTRDRVDR